MPVPAPLDSDTYAVGLPPHAPPLGCAARAAQGAQWGWCAGGGRLRAPPGRTEMPEMRCEAEPGSGDPPGAPAGNPASARRALGPFPKPSPVAGATSSSRWNLHQGPRPPPRPLPPAARLPPGQVFPPHPALFPSPRPVPRPLSAAPRPFLAPSLDPSLLAAPGPRVLHTPFPAPPLSLPRPGSGPAAPRSPEPRVTAGPTSRVANGGSPQRPSASQETCDPDARPRPGCGDRARTIPGAPEENR